MARPGIMIYFDMLGPIRVLPDEDKGRLLIAMLEYGQSGIAPQFDGMLALSWEFIKPKLDRDGETYENSKIQRKYAAFCKRRTALNLPKVLFEEWISLSDNERERMVTGDNEPLRAVNFVASRYPTTTASTSTTAAAAATTPTTTTEQMEGLFNQLWMKYPENHRGSIQDAMNAYFLKVISPEDANTAEENLKLWMRSEQWTKCGGQFIPHMCNWIDRDYWKKAPKPKSSCTWGASGELGDAELEAISQVMGEVE